MDHESQQDPLALKVWVRPFALIFATSALSFFLLYMLDYSLGQTKTGLFSLFFSGDRESAINILGSVAEVMAAVLGIAITVVAIIVELAANRYTSRVTDLFVRDRVNFLVLALFVVATLQCLWTGASFREDFAPMWEVRWTLLLMTLSLLLLLPYFNYVFEFLQPTNIINSIRKQVMGNLHRIVDDPADARLTSRKLQVMSAAEQITDIALNSILQRDRGLAMNSTLILRSLVVDSLELKPKLPESWYKIEDSQRRNPDFVTLSEHGISDIEDDRIWVEYKIFKQFNLIFAQSLNHLRDLNNLIAMCFRDIGVVADRLGDDGARRLTINFFNTILRTTLNGKDVRTGYNVLHQYRQFCSHLIQQGREDLVLTVFQHFKYYGLLFDSQGMGFILETVAYDLYRLTREAADAGLQNEGELLAVFLEVDRPPDPGSSDRHLRGVRKAQAMLAAYFLSVKKAPQARLIARDMSAEPLERLDSIKREILSAERRFWEITDRGVNFDFVEPELRPSLERFFEDQVRTVREEKASASATAQAAEASASA
jgi:hypothetical protein